jgi:septum site-determining protein MinC
MLTAGAVQVTGRGTDIAFVIDDEAPIGQVAKELGEYLADKGSMFSKGNITVDAGRRMLSRGELGRIRQIIERNSGLTVTRFWCSPDALDALDGVPFNWEAQAAVPQQEPPPLPAPVVEPPPIAAPPTEISVAAAEKLAEDLTKDHGRNRSQALLIKATFRSGEIVKHSGDVVVLADVNPGSEIWADGDIVVLGALKGLAHAGAAGDTKATIVATELASPRIGIGPYDAIAQPPGKRSSKSSANRPKIAFVRRRSIYVAPFVGRYARYTKGVPYDG